MREFDLLKIVEEFFGNEEVEVPAGKHDAAYLRIGKKLIVVSCDTVNEKSDFPPFMLPEEMGHMAVAVTLSDLAACGAKPLYFLSSISMKTADDEFFRKLLIGMRGLASRYGVKVVGGDIDFSSTLTIVGKIYVTSHNLNAVSRCEPPHTNQLFQALSKKWVFQSARLRGV